MKTMAPRKISWTLFLLFISPLFLFITKGFALDVTLQWDANAESDIAGYRAYFKTGSSGGGTLGNYNGIGAIEGSSPINIVLVQDENADPSIVEFTLHGLSNDETYYFVVTAYDTENRESAASNEVYINPSPGTPDTTAPVISSVQATSMTHESAVITWTTNEPATSIVRYGTTSGNTWANYPSSRTDSTLVTTHSVTLTGLTGGTTYYFRVGSIDIAENGPTISPESAFSTPAPPDITPPSIVPYPRIDYAGRTIDLTFTEPNMQNARTEANFTFSPSLLFRSLGGTDDISPLNSNTYRLYMSYVPENTIIILTLNAVTDQAGNPVTPNTVRINDNDYDLMADDWEATNQIDSPQADADSDGLNNLEEFQNLTNPYSQDTDGDTLPDKWEVTYGIDPRDAFGLNGPDGDPDNDGWPNDAEYSNNTNPMDATSALPLPTIEIVEAIPHNDAGITDTYRVPTDTSVSYRVEASDGVNITDSKSLVFLIDDGVNQPYQRDLDDEVVRVVKLTSDDDTEVTKLWVVYDRARDIYGDFPFDSNVNIRIDAKGASGVRETNQTSNFKIESEIQHLEANDPANLPVTGAVDPSDPSMDGVVYDAGIEVYSEDAGEFKIIYNSSEPVQPRVGNSFELPPLTEVAIKPKKDKGGTMNSAPEHANAKANRVKVTTVGLGMNLQPPTVFNKPVKLFIPCPGYEDVSMLSVLLYNGKEWVLASDANGNVMPDGEGWVVPGSRVNHNFMDDPLNNPSTIEIKVHHFSGAQAGEVIEPLDLTIGEGAKGGGGCFIATSGWEPLSASRRELPAAGISVPVPSSEYGRAFVGAFALWVVVTLCICGRRPKRGGSCHLRKVR